MCFLRSGCVRVSPPPVLSVPHLSRVSVLLSGWITSPTGAAITVSHKTAMCVHGNRFGRKRTNLKRKCYFSVLNLLFKLYDNTREIYVKTAFYWNILAKFYRESSPDHKALFNINSTLFMRAYNTITFCILSLALSLSLCVCVCVHTHKHTYTLKNIVSTHYIILTYSYL